MNEVAKSDLKPKLYVSDDQKMDQRSVGLYLVLKGLSARATHEDLVATLGADAVACSSVTRHLRETRASASIDGAPSIDIPMVIDDAD
jgi:hypothetical protein